MAFQVVPEPELEEILQDEQSNIATLLEQTDMHMEPIVKAMKLKKSAGKGFTEFLLYIIKLFRKAIENKTITMKNSKRLSVLTELKDISQVLHNVLENQFNTHDKRDDQDDKSLNSAIALVVRCANKVEEVIKSLQKTQWLRLFRSAKNINTFIPIFEKITKVVKGIECIDCRPFSELIGDVETLKAALNDIKTRILDFELIGLTTSIVLGIGSFIFVVVGGILLATPAAPLAVPFIAAGASGVGVSFVTGSGVKLCSCLADKRLRYAEAKGEVKGNKFLEEEKSELSQLNAS